jgi:hypothetical protein
MGGTDIGASFSGSSSATSGLRTDGSYRYGDVIVGPPGLKSKPVWLWLALGGMALAAVTVWLIRR